MSHAKPIDVSDDVPNFISMENFDTTGDNKSITNFICPL